MHALRHAIAPGRPPATGPPGTRIPQYRTTTAQLPSKNQAVAAATHEDLLKETIMASATLTVPAVIAAVRARGFSPTDNNEADALAILLWAIETNGGVR